MSSACQNGHQPRDDRGVERDLLRVFTKEFLCQVDQIVHAASALHGSDGRDNGHDDADDIEGDIFAGDGDAGEA